MPNHLITEKSPYLLQHAHNPVNWRPWNEEAFETARRQDKPIFLSIGYSTCHWCHVMERESFENEQIASVLNDYFVPIKVDREERPDVDRIYMSFVQATTGSGGWPMSVFLTPDLKPFFGGTYFPPDNRYGRPGFLAVLQSLTTSWYTEREKINQSSAEVIAHLEQAIDARPGSAAVLNRSILDAGFNYFRRTYDSTHGGFGGAPKFPRPVIFQFLLRYYARTKNADALEMTLKTLRAMAEGGMNDQLGGGFHRYSVDETWFLPHFEKMLYDQAQLVTAFVEAFQITRDPFYAQIARNTLDYVLRDLTDQGGAFYSAEDADSVIDPAHPHDKGEGAFYVWTRQELDSILGAPASEIFANRYGVEPGGNVHNDPHGEFPGKNILFVRQNSDQDPATKESIAKLLEVRATRIRPYLDDKILTAWNGLMISAFAKAAQVLEEPRYAQAASRAAAFILARMYDPATRILLRRYRDRDAAIPGFQDDYAFFVQALLDLYETDFEPSRLETAAALTDKMMELFEDTKAGGFFATSSDDPALVMRLKDDYDGAEPSGNAVALLSLLRLEQFTHREEYGQAAERTLNGLAGRLIGQPAAAPLLLAGLDYFLSPKRQVIITGSIDDSRTTAMLQAVRSHFSPNSVTILTNSNEPPTASVCENFVCQLPVTDLEKLTGLLQ